MPPIAVEAPPAATAGTDHIGMIAGDGNFPFLVARAARERGIAVTAIGIEGITPEGLAAEVGAMHWVQFGKMSRLIEVCHSSGIAKAVMVGRVRHANIFQLSKIDWRGMKMLAKAPTRLANDLLTALTEELAGENIEVLDSTLLLRECMPGAGLLTPTRPPDSRVLADIEFGRPRAKSIAGLDVGQTIAVKEGTVVAVEAMEGTNAAIMRAGEIGGAGCVIIKVCKPNQDRRFDVPIIGLTTVKKLVRAECAALAFPGSEVLFFEQEEACRLAAENGVTIYAW